MTNIICDQKWLMEDLKKISPLFDGDLGIGYRRHVCPSTPPVALSLADYRREMIKLADYYLTYPGDENVDYILDYLNGGLWYRVPLVEDAEVYEGIDGVEVPESNLWSDWQFFMAPVWWCYHCHQISLSVKTIAPYSEGKMDADIQTEHGIQVEEMAGSLCHKCGRATITYRTCRHIGFPNLKPTVNENDTQREFEQKRNWAHHLNQLPTCYKKRRGNHSVNKTKIRIKKNQVMENFIEIVWLRLLELVEESDYLNLVSQSPISNRISYYLHHT